MRYRSPGPRPDLFPRLRSCLCLRFRPRRLAVPLLAVAALVCHTSGSAAGPNSGGYLVLHTDDSVTYTWDDVASYSGYTIPECPWVECYEDDAECVDFIASIDATSNKPAEEPAVFWVIAAFSPNNCPRVNAVAFGIDWDVDGNQPTFVGWGSCGDWELSQDDWPTTPHSGTVVSFSSAHIQHAIPMYWFAAFSYYGETQVRLTIHPSEGEARFADDSVPSKLDGIEPSHLGSMGLGGAWGTNSYLPGAIPVLESSWGGVKAQFRE